MKNINTIALVALVFIGSTLLLNAQPGNPTSPAPLDGGISLLLAAGAAFGGKKYYDAKKKID
ncbi:PID-CTERM protein-sorting domain-containing protein [Owenweeksia hongkongensis]|uniref:PEP-CTERM sorting domain-containing protein n=1 Tax=Owenweeksia hongkongensis (strain DSM 17368 / CIP 108786 / JCM 12287 / NRRL B-23963 / UST20020801) TaxID=926562 RepID=G8R2Y9_OWEHD|nr:hypothetical protein [Owenweeksia hongkongensis]AEV32983.1 hypothetical protein Oweho_2006 [Owenweeksia hongkongensis DSM 17368]